MSSPNVDEQREITGEVEWPSLEEQLDLEGVEDELAENESKITYTRALLLKFTEAEVCRKLPGDFDLLILSELNEVDGGTLENKRISGDSSLLGAFPDTGFHYDRLNNYLVMPTKERQQGNRSSEESNVVWQHSPQESRYSSMVSSDQKTSNSGDQKTSNSGSFQLRKSENPYRPPHRSKTFPRPLYSFSQVGVESSASSSFSAILSDQQSSTDRVMGNEEPGLVSPLETPDDSIKQLHECESSSSSNKEISKVYDGCDKLELQIIDDGQPTFEDFWADILESLQRQQEAELRPIPAPDSDDMACLPDADSFISIDDPKAPNTFNVNTHENDYDASSSEAEIIWPDEDSLISVEDMLGPIMPLDTDFVGTNKVASNVEAAATNDVGCLNVKTHFQPFFHPGNNYLNFPTKSNYTPNIPAPNSYTCSNFLNQSCLNNARPNVPYVLYSMFQEPDICPRQQKQLPVDLCLSAQQTTYPGFRKPNAGGFVGKEASSFWHARH